MSVQTRAKRRAAREAAGTVIPDPPTDAEKYSYVSRALPYLAVALLISSTCVIAAQVFFEVNNLVALPFAIYTFSFFVYQAISLPMNFFGPGFDLKRHRAIVARWWPRHYPSVDIFLPICGEPIDVLRNTWEGVFELIHAYPGDARVYVLDDGPSEDARRVAPAFGFTYVRRPQLRYHKKSGNLNYAFEHTDGDHIVIFDADFRPRRDFLTELLPYMDDPEIGLVQSPQYFRVDESQTWVEQAAGASLEVFYRAVQVSRDRFGSALCVGSNAVYRRAALAAEGGFTQIPYAEDSHTGLDMRYHGYQLKYLPIVLAAGVCPADIDSYMKQQYRWCCGATSLVWSRHMWDVPMKFRARLPYVAGWLWNFVTGMRTVIAPLFPITILALLPEQVKLHNALLLLPVVINGMILYPLWHNNRYPPGMWPLAIATGWAQVLALWDYARGKVMSWQPSRGPGDASRRFRKAVLFWNGSLALIWLLLVAWRYSQDPSTRFLVVGLFGLLNAVVVGRVLLPGNGRAA